MKRNSPWYYKFNLHVSVILANILHLVVLIPGKMFANSKIVQFNVMFSAVSNQPYIICLATKNR